VTPPRRERGGLAAGTLAALLLLAACASTPSSLPPTTAPSASQDPGAAVTIDVLLANPAARDGRPVRLTGNFIGDGTTARLCEIMLESYPPQCGGGAIRVTGEIPAATLGRLTTTTEPGLAKAWWGFVVVTGTFHAHGVDGGPSLDLNELILKEG
jgi:hypothetical protein